MKTNRLFLLIIFFALLSLSCTLTDKILESSQLKFVDDTVSTLIPKEIKTDDLVAPLIPKEIKADYSVIDVDLATALKFSSKDFENLGFSDDEIPTGPIESIEMDNRAIQSSSLYDNYKYLIEDGERLTGWYYTGEMRFDKKLFLVFDKYPDHLAANNAIEHKEVLGTIGTVKNKKELGENAIIQTEPGFILLDFSYRNFSIQIMIESDNQESVEKLATMIKNRLTELPTVDSISKPVASSAYDVVVPGMYLVGVDIAPGVYRSNGSSDSCYWSKTDKYGEIIDNYFGMAGGTIYISNSDFQVELNEDCGNWISMGD